MSSINIEAFANITDLIASEVEQAMERNRETAFHNLVETIERETDKLVPYRTGNLASSVAETPTGFKYSANYASFAFDPTSKSGKPKNYIKSVHPFAQGNPVEKSYNDNSKAWAEQYARDLLKGVGT